VTFDGDSRPAVPAPDERDQQASGIPQAAEMREVFVPGEEIMVVFTAARMRQIGFPASEFLSVSRA